MNYRSAAKFILGILIFALAIQCILISLVFLRWQIPAPIPWPFLAHYPVGLRIGVPIVELILITAIGTRLRQSRGESVGLMMIAAPVVLPLLGVFTLLSLLGPYPIDTIKTDQHTYHLAEFVWEDGVMLELYECRGNGLICYAVGRTPDIPQSTYDLSDPWRIEWQSASNMIVLVNNGTWEGGAHEWYRIP